MKLHPLDSAWEKIRRANETIGHLDAEIAQFLKDTKPAVRIGDDQHSGERTVGVDDRLVPPLRYAVIAGEIVHHLRSALDHVAYQLVIINNGTPDNKTEFPIFFTQDHYRAGHVSKVRAMSDPAKTRIESLQPFQRGHPAALDDPLGLVHRLDVADRHRLLVVVARRTALDYVISSGPWPSQQGGVTITNVSPDSSTQANTVVARFTAPPELNVRPHVDCEVVFEKVGTTQDEPLIPTLRSLSDRVRSTIGLFAEFFP